MRKVYVIENDVNIADAVTAKGSALAAADVIEALNIPTNSVILAGGVEVKEVMTGTSSNLALDVGITGGDVDVFCDGFAWAAGTAVGTYNASGVQAPTVVTTADTVDILIATQTGTLTGGVLRVWAIIADVNDNAAPGTTQPGS